MTDVAVEAGVAKALLPRLNGSFTAGWTLDPDFRPGWKVTAEAEILAMRRTPASALPAIWALTGLRYDVYETLEVGGIHPGLRLEWDEPWTFAARLNRVQEIGASALYGWTVRVDGPLPAPQRYGLRFWVGAADAPETVRAATVSTRSVFAGVGVDVGSDWIFSMVYVRDDREDSWIRHAVNAAVARRF
jgi:YaiO family outer membrane protein